MCTSLFLGGWELVDLLKRAESANWLAAGVAVGGNGGGDSDEMVMSMMMMSYR